MAKKKTTSRHGKIPTGWAGQGLQIPKEWVKDFREESGRFGHGGVKVLGTAAIAIVLALDEEDRDTLCNYVWQKTRTDAADLDKARVLELLKVVLSKDVRDIPVIEPTWIVDEMIDPDE